MTWKREIAKILYPRIFDDVDEARGRATFLNNEWSNCKKENDKLRQQTEELNNKIIELKTPKKADLSKFLTTKTRKINSKYKLLNSVLKSEEEYEIVKDWNEDSSFNFINDVEWDDDKFVYEVRLQFYRFLGNKDIHVSEKQGIDIWLKPSETIKAKFKVDCEDMAIFLHYLYQVLSDLYNRPRIKDNLYLVLGGTNTKDGWSDGNHAYLLWKHSDEKFYVIESAYSRNGDYIKDALQKFGLVCHKDNIRYGKIVYMSSINYNYYQVRL